MNRIDIIKIALENYFSSPDNLIVITEMKKIKEGWILFYNSKKYLETKNPSYQLAGYAAVMFDKVKNLYYPMGVAGETWENALSSYRNNTYIFHPIGQLDLDLQRIIKI